MLCVVCVVRESTTVCVTSYRKSTTDYKLVSETFKDANAEPKHQQSDKGERWVAIEKTLHEGTK